MQAWDQTPLACTFQLLVPPQQVTAFVGAGGGSPKHLPRRQPEGTRRYLPADAWKGMDPSARRTGRTHHLVVIRCGAFSLRTTPGLKPISWRLTNNQMRIPAGMLNMVASNLE